MFTDAKELIAFRQQLIDGGFDTSEAFDLVELYFGTKLDARANDGLVYLANEQDQAELDRQGDGRTRPPRTKPRNNTRHTLHQMRRRRTHIRHRSPQRHRRNMGRPLGRNNCPLPQLRAHNLRRQHMSRTRRTRYNGETIRDGEHGHRCPSANCSWCVPKPAIPERDDTQEQHPSQ